MSPLLSGSKRSLDDSGVMLTLVESLSTAAATARQKSMSKPVQLPLSSGLENPRRPWLVPQTSEPRSFTFLSVWADAAVIEQPSAKATPNRRISRFMGQPLMDRFLEHTLSSLARSLREFGADVGGLLGSTPLLSARWL